MKHHLDISSESLVLYDFPLSGHCHRVRLFLSLLGQAYERVPVNLLTGEQRRSEFAALNPAMQVPVLRDGKRVIADSNAILVYLAKRNSASKWLPEDPEGAAAVQRWFSVSARELTQGPGRARAMTLFKRPGDLEQARRDSEVLLARINAHLQGHSFLVGDTPTLADLACYTYVALAPEGGVALEPYAEVLGWLARLEALPGFESVPAVSTH